MSGFARSLLALGLGALALTGCQSKTKIDPNDPSTIENSSKYEPKVGGPGIDGAPSDKPK